MSLISVTKFHKILITTIRLSEHISCEVLNFHIQKAIFTEGKFILKQCDQVHKILIKVLYLESGSFKMVNFYN